MTKIMNAWATSVAAEHVGGLKHIQNCFPQTANGRQPGELLRNFIPLDSARGISDEAVQERIREWLVEVHSPN